MVEDSSEEWEYGNAARIQDTFIYSNLTPGGNYKKLVGASSDPFQVNRQAISS